ncbi:hypothetical protein CDIK_0830 [Cucumispora dikerogammari]|nr:hypothetical protein CDIK_0830 [Cucumispora dikerogammari]
MLDILSLENLKKIQLYPSSRSPYISMLPDIEVPFCLDTDDDDALLGGEITDINFYFCVNLPNLRPCVPGSNYYTSSLSQASLDIEVYERVKKCHEVAADKYAHCRTIRLSRDCIRLSELFKIEIKDVSSLNCPLDIMVSIKKTNPLSIRTTKELKTAIRIFKEFLGIEPISYPQKLAFRILFCFSFSSTTGRSSYKQRVHSNFFNIYFEEDGCSIQIFDNAESRFYNKGLKQQIVSVRKDGIRVSLSYNQLTNDYSVVSS